MEVDVRVIVGGRGSRPWVLQLYYVIVDFVVKLKGWCNIKESINKYNNIIISVIINVLYTVKTLVEIFHHYWWIRGIACITICSRIVVVGSVNRKLSV